MLQKARLSIVLLTLFIFLSPSFAAAQALNSDSLWSVWQDETQPDTNRLKALYKIAWEGYLFSKPDTAFYFGQLYHDFAKTKGLKRQMAKALNLQGVSFSERGNSPKALDYYQKSLKIKYEIGDRQGIAGSLGNIGHLYNSQEDYPKALEYFKRSLKIEEELGDKRWIASSLNNIGIVYQSQAEYGKALDHFQRSLKLFTEVGIKQGIAACLGNMGSIYQSQNDYSMALDYFQQGLDIRYEIGDKTGAAVSLISIGGIYHTQGFYKRAISECQKGLQLANEIGIISTEREACNCLYDAYKALGDGNKALVYHEQMLVLDDSLKTGETTKQLERMEFQKAMLQDSIAKVKEADLIEKVHQEEVQKEKQTRNWSFAVGAMALLIAGGFYSRWRYVRKSRDIISKERDRSDNLLLNILPEEIAQELKEKGKADARDFEMVSILFTDFKGFTEHSAKLSAAELVHEINTFFEAFDSICEKYNVEKIKTIGDAYMAAGGLPLPTDDSVKNTVLAALEMQEFITKRKAVLDDAGRPAFEMRVGIHTGPVVAGIVGVKKFQYDIWGDTVNTASRMESSGEVGQVNISQATYELLKDTSTPLGAASQFAFESRGKIEAKGKGMVEMWFVKAL